MAQPVEYEQVTYNDDAGAMIGNATTTKLGFYGTTPIAKPTVSGSASSGAGASSIAVALAALGLTTGGLAA